MIAAGRGAWARVVLVGAAFSGCFKPLGMQATESGAATGSGTDASEVTGGGEATRGSEVAATGAATDPGTTRPTTSSDTASGTTFGPDDPVCGNGVVERGEACDAGGFNGVDQPCTPACQLAICGDGLTCTGCTPAEVCDDGNLTPGDGCEPVVCAPGVCGDAVVDAGEECDPQGPDCSPRCLLKRKYVFVSSSVHTGDFGGIAGADQICRKLGQSKFALRREFVAWLSDGSSSAVARIGNSGEPYMLPSTTVVAANQMELVSGSLQNPISESEAGVAVGTDFSACGESLVWTGTARTGFTSGSTCGDWTGTSSLGATGNYMMKDASWTNAKVCDACGATQLRLYCVEKVVL